jgi:hypothetical protein
MAEPMPVLFFGHGNPMNALQQNSYTKAWAEIGNQIPKPRAILSGRRRLGLDVDRPDWMKRERDMARRV